MPYCGKTDSFFSRWLYVIALFGAVGNVIMFPIMYPNVLFTMLVTLLYSSYLGPYKKKANQTVRSKRRKSTRRKRRRLK